MSLTVRIVSVVAVVVVFGGLLGSLPAVGQYPIVINEFFRTASSFDPVSGDEWVELVLQQDLNWWDLDSFFVGDSTSATLAKNSAYKFDYTWAILNQTSLGMFPKGTVIVVGGGGAFGEDTSYDPNANDWDIYLNTGGGYLIDWTGNTMDLEGADVIYVDTDGTFGNATLSTYGFAVHWDGATTLLARAMAPAAPTGGEFGDNATVTLGLNGPSEGQSAALTGALDDAASPAFWTTTSTPSLGTGNGGDNSESIDQLQPVEDWSMFVPE